ncbi:hypothetical protein [Gracilibacillus sp. JCM 18860]|uniref:hypothetical protein n=1 Tax=Gracilibacillus sp. JCM 18860 TaxID=1306159 RepID=UPI003261AD76
MDIGWAACSDLLSKMNHAADLLSHNTTTHHSPHTHITDNPSDWQNIVIMLDLV